MPSSRSMGRANKKAASPTKMGKAAKPGSPKRVKGDFVPFRLSLAGCRDSVPAGVWGNAPTVPRATSMPNALNKGAGSEASLPVTLRSRRSAPKLLYPTSMQCRAKWARPDCLTSDHSWSFPQAGVSPLQRRNPCLRERPAMVGSQAIWSRPFGATLHRCWVEQLGGAPAGAQSYWQGRFAACAFVERVGHTGRPRNSWGVAPNPSRDAVPAPCKGQTKRDEVPLDPFWAARLGCFTHLGG